MERLAGKGCVLTTGNLRVVDSHTAGEPTRVVVAGGPDLGTGSVAEQQRLLEACHDDVRKTAILEPRGSEALVGALLCPSPNEDCATGVVFFNNVGYLGMCGHGAIGVAATLFHLGLVGLGPMRMDTPVGVVGVELTAPNEATIENVESYCWRRDVTVDVADVGTVRGDIAWGGNWFYLVDDVPVPIDLAHAADLRDYAKRIKHALVRHGVTGARDAEIDHIELCGAPGAGDADGRNFVLCPGDAYDRSPCGTGTSAKLACLAERGLLAPGETWVQESVIGSRFSASYSPGRSGGIVPAITGQAFISAEATLIRQPGDPFRNGIV